VELRARHTPVVLIDRTLPGLDVDAVIVDNEQAARRAVEHLTGLGHRRIALLTSQGLIHTNQARLAGYLQGLEAAGVQPSDELVRMAQYTREAAVREAEIVLALRDPATAIFTTDNLMSLGAYEGAQRAGRAVPDEVRGRVFGLLDSAVVLAILAGSLIVSPLVTAFGLSRTLLVIGVGVSVLAIAGVRRTFVLDRVGSAEVDSLAPIIELLASLPILELAQRPSIEQLAKASTVVEIDAGATVIAQGAPADDLYAVIAGELDIDVVDATGGRQTVADARAGDYFGEVGLIHSVPRTATVSARGPARLVRVPGAAFLDALSSSPAAWARAVEGATTRLGRQPFS
jgi:hypothetical protein